MYSSKAEDYLKKIVGVSDFYYALKRFDRETFNHSEEVARLAIMIAKKQGYSSDRLVNIAISGYLHDIGKIFTGIDIVGKKDALSNEEYNIIKEHPEVGYRHIKNFLDNEEVLLGILQHHERVDGKGYPNQLEGDEISEFAKIIAVADVFSAMTSVRPYKKAFSCEKAFYIMINSKGFDYDVLKTLVCLCLDGKVAGTL